MKEVFKKIKESLHKEDLEFMQQSDLMECIDSVIDKVASEYNNGWISVKDRLPEKEGSYLVIGKTGGAVVTRWYEPSKYHPNGHFGGNTSDYIRYWMPRPKLYNEEGE